MVERIDFSQRAELEEQMDGPCSFEELRHCLRDLALVNRLTMAHKPIMEWLERVTNRLPQHREPTSRNPDVARPPMWPDRPLRIVDVGCGYGDMLRRIERWAAKRGIAVELIGVDLNANAVRAAREATPPGSRIAWIAGDVYSCPEAVDADIVTTSGVMHHLAESEIVRMLKWMEATALVGWFIADLHRKPVPYKVFDVTMRGPWWQRFIRPDGLTSIRRSFLADDWRRMCAAAGLDVDTVEIAESRPARLCVGRLKQAAR